MNNANHDGKYNEPENMPLCLYIRQRELDLSVNTTRANESRIECFNPVGSHDDFDITACVEPIELIE